MSATRRRANGAWGRRQRRLRRTTLVLVIVAVVAGIGGLALYRATRPDVRVPGEELPEITRKLARDLPAEAPMPRFTDVTAEAGLGDFRAFAGHRTSQLPEDMGAGAAWGDFDGDGDDDLFLVGAGGQWGLPREQWTRSRLYVNRGNGTFQESTEFPELRIAGMSAAWGDYDGDGDLDLAVTGYDTLLLLRNDDGEFVRDPALPEMPGFWAGASWADFDLDGDLDLYVCGYVRYEPEAHDRRLVEQYGRAVPYTLNPASFEPERNLLFRNEGDGTFSEMALVLGVSNPGGRSLSALWHDFDADGRPDLYVANDISDNALFLNRQEGFEDAGLAAFVADYRGAMGLAAGDWNRDGDDDLFVTHWIAQENALYDSRLAEIQRPGHSVGPMPLRFSDMATPLGLGQVALPFVGWGTEFGDFDGDGWLDLIVANGSTLETTDDPPRLKPQRMMLFWNRQGRYFHDLAPLDPVLSEVHVSRGLAVSDYDQDGDLDVLVVDLDGGVRMLRNDMQTGHWLELVLERTAADGRASDLSGATVIVHADGVTLRRSVSSASYLSQSSRTLHFGLGASQAAEGIEVYWPDGARQQLEAVAADSRWRIAEDAPFPERLPSRDVRAEREWTKAFWAAQRDAMDVVKGGGDPERAVELLRRALQLQPGHEDSRYYLANALAALGRTQAALYQLDLLRRAHPGSHRAQRQWALLRTATATSPGELEAAREALERALEINREETGSLLVLGEVELLQGEFAAAERHLELACRTNPNAAGGFFLRGYLAWKRGELVTARKLLEATRTALGPDWKPHGAVAEGDVLTRAHEEMTPLSRFWSDWDLELDPDAAFRQLDAHLRSTETLRSDQRS